MKIDTCWGDLTDMSIKKRNHWCIKRTIVCCCDALANRLRLWTPRATFESVLRTTPRREPSGETATLNDVHHSVVACCCRGLRLASPCEADTCGSSSVNGLRLFDAPALALCTCRALRDFPIACVIQAFIPAPAKGFSKLNQFFFLDILILNILILDDAHK